MRTDRWYWSEAKGEVLDEQEHTVARVVSDSAADPKDGDGPIMAASRDMLYALELLMNGLDRVAEGEDYNTVVDETGMIAVASDAIHKARS